ncbi:tripartite tricarboxylate transporter substrate binding protein [Variovorax sp. LjRoot290]|uniref:Bug family tripartite tricarboxylate transporter substrate binding protein n=1 Tax=Variovorax sp. LjRoot290 TaxID=3342316 RepID=UPI003ECFCABF
MDRRTMNQMLAAAALAPLAASAQPSFPTRPIRIVVAYPAGGASDFIARMVGDRLSKTLGQPVVVDNRTGASGALGVSEVAKAPPDGYTLGVTLGDSLINNVALFKALPYDPQRDLALMTQAVFSPALISANTDLPVKNIAELRQYAAQHKGQLSYGSWGIGSLGHIAGEALSQRLGASMVHIPQRGEGPVLQDLLSKTISLGLSSAGLAKQHVLAGKITPLAILGRERSKALPGVPTLREQGIDDPIFDAAVWICFIAPGKTPQPVLQKLIQEIRTILALPDVDAAVVDRGLEVMATTPVQFRTSYRGEFDIITRRIREIGIEPQ